MKTVVLLFWCAVVYSILLVLVRGAFPSESSPSLFLVGLPLVVIAVFITRDLVKRSTLPTIPTATSAPPPHPEDDPVEVLSGQIRVAVTASDSYFESLIRGRLKELLITKVSLETGLERNIAARILSDSKEGPKLLHNQELHTTLYGRAPVNGSERIEMIQKTIRMIGEWKGWT